jgi:hypothetical protein
VSATAPAAPPQEHLQPREFVPDVPSAYHGMMSAPMAAHPQVLAFSQNQDPVYGNIEDLYDEDEIQPMITLDQIKFNQM